MGVGLRKRNVKRLPIKSLLRSLRKMQKQSFLTVLLYQRWNCSAGRDLQRWSKLHLSGDNQKLKHVIEVVIQMALEHICPC